VKTAMSPWGSSYEAKLLYRLSVHLLFKTDSDPWNWTQLKLRGAVRLLKRRGDKNELVLRKLNEIKLKGKIL
jgi:hypothetical protein